MTSTVRAEPLIREAPAHVTLPLATALISLGVYLLTIAPDLTWANGAIDGGELITASATLGIPHPPGYATYVLAGKLFSFLPVGTVAFRYNLFAAVCAAGAAGLLAAAICTFHRRSVSTPSVLATTLAFSFAPLVWGQAVVAEVYSLNLLILAAFLLAWSRRGATGASGFWLGMAVTTHLTSALLIPLLFVRGSGKTWRPWLGLVLGLWPLLVLPWLAQGKSSVVWGDVSTLAGWWWLVSGQIYGANFRLTFDSERFLALLRSFFLGLGILLNRPRGTAPPTRSAESAPVAADLRRSNVLLGIIAGAYFLFAVLYDSPDAAIYMLPGLMILALLIAPQLNRLGPFALLIPVMLVMLTFPSRDAGRYAPVRPAAESILSNAPEHAILLTPGDRTIFTLWYFHHVEGLRPDIRLVDSNLFAFDWYRHRLGTLHPELELPDRDDLDAFEQANLISRPVCNASLIETELNEEKDRGPGGDMVIIADLSCARSAK